MAMNGNTLGQEIADVITASNASSEAKAQVLELWQKIGNAIVKHIIANAEVPAGISVATSGGAGKTDSPGKVT
jgi:predicted HAD superfamily phosphohydrolase